MTVNKVEVERNIKYKFFLRKSNEARSNRELNKPLTTEDVS